MREAKGLVLLSGGLDSILAAKILKNQGIKVVALSFRSYFFNEGAAKKAAKSLRIPLKVVDFSEEHLKMVKNPKHGYGKSMNPCIDCHALMLKKAKEIIHPVKSLRSKFNRVKKDKFDFVATGEVLGERPMSQNIKALKIIEIQSSLKGYLLRPLSAKLLKETIPEQKGLVDRKKLFDISGRSRKRQIALAKKWQIQYYPMPAGGCLLTDPVFSQRSKELFQLFPQCNGNDVELLKHGRHFIQDKTKIIVGRNEKENKAIKKLAKRGDILIEMANYPGPLTLVRNYTKKKISQEIIKKAKDLTQCYSTKARDKKDVNFYFLN